MNFKLSSAIEILERTPQVLSALLNGLSDAWVQNNEGEDTWSPFDVVGHLIHGDKTDWMVRAEIILSDGQDKAFEPFDRFAQFEESKGKTIGQLLEEFRSVRAGNLALLKTKEIEGQLQSTGIHPTFGEVTLEQLLSTWAVHDLGHIAQITRVMAKQYKEEVGPWQAFLPVLGK